jgi:hypothetical protein
MPYSVLKSGEGAAITWSVYHPRRLLVRAYAFDTVLWELQAAVKQSSGVTFFQLASLSETSTNFRR